MTDYQAPTLDERRRRAVAFDVTRTSDLQPAPLPLVSPPPTMRNAAPLQVRDAARYDLVGEHGRGGLGRVLRAHDKELGRDVAIKELLDPHHGNEVRFFREALITARLEHPNIVPVHEAGRWADGTPFYAMKLVAGRPLKELIEATPLLHDRLALLPNVIAVADAIAYAHGQRVIHRDLKPSNILIGDFGETVVIDWGLAKVIDEADGPAASPYRTAARDELTVAGSILGTPAYMAPEQADGKADERADIYALGAVVYAVVTGDPPPEQPRLRGDAPRDLVAIVERAMARDPDHRYRTMRELAADLRRFLRREPVAARSYSVAARVALGVTRHRTLSLTLFATSLVVTAILGVAVARISDERAGAVTARNDLTLKHAELLLQTDPTAAVAALADYRGDNTERRDQLAAEARGRGVARQVIRPHADTVVFAVGEADGAIVSLGMDRLVQRTRGGVTTTLASDVSFTVRHAYAPRHRVLAYGTTAGGVALLDLGTGTVTRLAGAAPDSLAFSHDETRLATLDHDGNLAIWSLGPQPRIVQHDRIARAAAVAFVGDTHVVVRSDAGAVHAVALDGTAAHDRDLRARWWDAGERYLVTGDLDGNVTVLAPTLETVATLAACPTVVVQRVQLAGDLVAFGCRNGSAGVAKLAGGALEVVDRFTVPAPLGQIALDPATGTVYATSDATLFIHDRASGVTVRRMGQPMRTVFLAAPRADFHLAIAGDQHGELRLWEPPAPAARVLARVPATTFGLRFAPDGRSLATYGTDGTIRLTARDGGATTELRGHTAWVGDVHFAADGETLASFSWDGTARVWRLRDRSCVRVVPDHHAVIDDLTYLDGGSRLATVGDDGTLRSWSVAGEGSKVLLARSTPFNAVEALGGSGAIATVDSAGAVWLVAPDGAARQLRAPDTAAVTVLRASDDGRYVAFGTERGDIAVYRTADTALVARAHAAARIGRIEIDPAGREVLAAAQDGEVHVLALGDAARFRSTRLAIDAREIAYAADGELIAFTQPDGGAWLYRVADRRWFYVEDHANDQRGGKLSPDGRWLATVDGGGTVVLRNVAETMRAAE